MILDLIENNRSNTCLAIKKVGLGQKYEAHRVKA
jgi:hypothetical protein